ncbi:MAG: hypothetical protein JWQ78_1444 [Sediminibacterium sp.]|nr:hypothetical protein [Sediminibacterium sp.]
MTVSHKPGKETPFKTAYFFLHDTYSPGCIKKVIAEAGKASLKIPSYEAFTVGVYIEDADTKLELDLNEYPGTPPEYTFDEVLPTIDELRTKEKQLKEKPASPGR